MESIFINDIVINQKPNTCHNLSHQHCLTGRDHLTLLMFQEEKHNKNNSKYQWNNADDPTNLGTVKIIRTIIRVSVVIEVIFEIDNCLDANQDDEKGYDHYSYFDGEKETAHAWLLGKREAIFV